MTETRDEPLRRDIGFLGSAFLSFNGVVGAGSSRGIGAAVLSKFARAGASCVLQYWDDPDGASKKDAEKLAATLAALPNPPTLMVEPGDVRA
ncbi:MAG TPA: hypothetical protein VEW26_07720, partial [Allosphingosinicella sp.]|nr:hypothetical protein [Allosphingosinicella sp.]